MEGAVVALGLLACPVGMGLMMWFMSKGVNRTDSAAERTAREPTVEELRSERARLEAQIERTEDGQRGSNGELASR